MIELRLGYYWWLYEIGCLEQSEFQIAAMLYHRKSDNGNSVIMKIEDFWEIECRLPELCENKSLTYNIPPFLDILRFFIIDETGDC